MQTDRIEAQLTENRRNCEVYYVVQYTAENECDSHMRRLGQSQLSNLLQTRVGWALLPMQLWAFLEFTNSTTCTNFDLLFVVCNSVRSECLAWAAIWTMTPRSIQHLS